MTQAIQESVKMLEMLPESEQEFASQFIKRLVLAWDPDFTKSTQEEQERLEAAEQRIDNGEYVKDSDIMQNLSKNPLKKNRHKQSKL